MRLELIRGRESGARLSAALRASGKRKEEDKLAKLVATLYRSAAHHCKKVSLDLLPLPKWPMIHDNEKVCMGHDISPQRLLVLDHGGLSTTRQHLTLCIGSMVVRASSLARS